MAGIRVGLSLVGSYFRFPRNYEPAGPAPVSVAGLCLPCWPCPPPAASQPADACVIGLRRFWYFGLTLAKAHTEEIRGYEESVYAIRRNFTSNRIPSDSRYRLRYFAHCEQGYLDRAVP